MTAHREPPLLMLKLPLLVFMVLLSRSLLLLMLFPSSLLFLIWWSQRGGLTLYHSGSSFKCFVHFA